MTWDGLGFFGFDDSKLARLEGAPVKFTDKFKSFKYLIGWIVLLVIVILVMATELPLFGTVNQQEISTDYNT